MKLTAINVNNIYNKIIKDRENKDIDKNRKVQKVKTRNNPKRKGRVYND